MKTVSFTEFRNNASGFVTAAERGESVVVIRHGREVAVLGPAGAINTPSWKTPALRLSVKGAGLSTAILEERDRGDCFLIRRRSQSGFLEEAGSDDVESFCMRASDLGLSVICVPEIISAMNRRGSRAEPVASAIRGCQKTTGDKMSATRTLYSSRAQWLPEASRLLERNPLRAMDALPSPARRMGGGTYLRRLTAAVPCRCAEGLHAVLCVNMIV
jgi:prevent-host-death family protein